MRQMQKNRIKNFVTITTILSLFIILFTSIPVKAEENKGGTPAPIAYLNDKGQAEIQVKFYL